jgi:hypothetical protein
MERVLLEVDTARVGRSRAGLVYAGLAVRAGDVVFPAEGWVDNAVVVLSWWTDAALQLLDEATSAVEVRFMEGPFLVGLETSSASVWHASFVEAGLHRRTLFEVNMSVDSFLDSLISSSMRILTICREHAWWTTDADILEHATRALRERTA